MTRRSSLRLAEKLAESEVVAAPHEEAGPANWCFDGQASGLTRPENLIGEMLRRLQQLREACAVYIAATV
jgi:hypothetical protein